jgi:hypothetical protein
VSDLDVLDHITTTSLLGKLTREDLLSLDPLPEWVHLKGGETLIKQGDEGADYFLLVNGVFACSSRTMVESYTARSSIPGRASANHRRCRRLWHEAADPGCPLFGRY